MYQKSIIGIVVFLALSLPSTVKADWMVCDSTCACDTEPPRGEKENDYNICFFQVEGDLDAQLNAECASSCAVDGFSSGRLEKRKDCFTDPACP